MRISYEIGTFEFNTFTIYYRLSEYSQRKRSCRTQKKIYIGKCTKNAEYCQIKLLYKHLTEKFGIIESIIIINNNVDIIINLNGFRVLTS